MIDRVGSPLRRLARGSMPGLYARLRRVYLERWARPASVFTRHYEHAVWGRDETVSGIGSTLVWTEALREALPTLLRELDVRVFVDAGCGDFNWMKELDLPVERYVGIDVVPEMIDRNRRLYAGPKREFLLQDIVGEPLPQADLVLCRDCLIHLPNDWVRRFLCNARSSGARYLAATTMPGRPNREISMGEWREVDLEAPPFDLPPPARRLFDGSRQDLERWEAGELQLPRWIGIWHTDVLPR